MLSNQNILYASNDDLSAASGSLHHAHATCLSHGLELASINGKEAFDGLRAFVQKHSEQNSYLLQENGKPTVLVLNDKMHMNYKSDSIKKLHDSKRHNFVSSWSP